MIDEKDLHYNHNLKTNVRFVNETLRKRVFCTMAYTHIKFKHSLNVIFIELFGQCKASHQHKNCKFNYQHIGKVDDLPEVALLLT